MNSLVNLQQKIEYLLKQHKVVILRNCDSDWQNSFVKSFAKSRSVVDVSDPMLRERAMWNPEEFARNLPKPVLVYNLQYVPKLLACLANGDAPNGSYLCVVGQSYYIMEESCNLPGVTYVDLPLSVGDREPFYPCTDFLKKIQGKDVSANVMGNILQGKLCADAFADGEARDKFWVSVII